MRGLLMLLWLFSFMISARATEPAKLDAIQPFPINEAVVVECIGALDVNNQRFFVTLASSFSLTQQELNHLRVGACIAVMAEIHMEPTNSALKDELQKIPFMAIQSVNPKEINAFYNADLGRIEIYRPFLQDNVSRDAYIFTLSHELAHRLENSRAKIQIRQGVGAAAAVGGILTGFYRPGPKKIGIKRRIIGTAIAAAGATAVLCPDKFYNREIEADKRAVRVHYAYGRTQVGDEAAREMVLDSARELFKLIPDDKDEPCFAGWDGMKPIFNQNPHPGPKTRREHMRKELGMSK